MDKTKLILELMEDDKYCCFSHPGGFGKSLFIDTLKAIGRGERELFKNCFIYNSHYQWKKHPVVHIDFSTVPNGSPEILERGLLESLDAIARDSGVSISGSSSQMKLVSLVEELSKTGRVVVLMDDYDKPLTDTLKNPAIAERNQALLKNFINTLKGARLQSVFITGAGKPCLDSIFSGSNLTDLTMDPKYASLMGYTEEELRQYFKEHIQILARARSRQNKKVTESDIIREMGQWYNGYRFSTSPVTVYNPYSTLCFMKKGIAANYSKPTATSSFLVKQIPKTGLSLAELRNIRSTEQGLTYTMVDRLDPISFLFQSGYLTIQDYNKEGRSYSLDFPNKESKKSFFESLLLALIQTKSQNVAGCAKMLRQVFQDKDFAEFFKVINVGFAKIPYYLYSNAQEGYYQMIFIALLDPFGVSTTENWARKSGLNGSFELANKIYVAELKLDKKTTGSYKLTGSFLKTLKRKLVLNDK